MSKVAVTVWRGRVSPVFESAGRVVVADIENGKEVSREMHELPVPSPGPRFGATGGGRRATCIRKVDLLGEIGIDTIICGAVPDYIVEMMNSAGIEVVGWVSGDIEEIIPAFLSGNIYGPSFLMPGRCHSAGRQARRRGGKGGRGWGGTGAGKWSSSRFGRTD